MDDQPTAERSTSMVRPWLPGAVVLFVVASAGAAFFVVGALQEPEPVDPDYLLHPWGFLDQHEATLGLVSLFVFVVTGAVLVWARRTGCLAKPLPAQVIAMSLFAAWLGFGYRIMTTGVTGANIGGGGVILVTPVLALVTVGFVVASTKRTSKVTKERGRREQ